MQYKGFRQALRVRIAPALWIQIFWWASGMFATGAVWYFFSTHEYAFAIAAAMAAVVFAILAVMLQRRQDAVPAAATSSPQPPAQRDQLATSDWWETSDLRKEYVSRGLNHFDWSDAKRVAKLQQQGHEIVVLDDVEANIRYRIVNKSGEVLMAKRDA